jgi:hypothetical protein
MNRFAVAGCLVLAALLRTLPNGLAAAPGIRTGPHELAATAAGAIFVRVVQSGDAMPPGLNGAGGAFVSFDAPATDGTAVSFHSIGSGREGIFTTAGGPLAVVAERTTLLPGTQVNFAFFGGPILEKGTTILSGLGAGGVSGVYLGSGGGLAIVADVFTQVPDGFGTFTDFGGLDLQGGSAVIQGRDALGRPGIYRRGASGSLGLVADGATAVPGGGSFEFIDLPVAAGRSVLFRAGGLTGLGIWSASRAGLAPVVDTKTPIPGAPVEGTTFGFLEQIAAGGGQAVFVGGDAGFTHYGLYSTPAGAGGKAGVVADILTPLPGGGGTFVGFGSPGVSRAAVVFTGFGSNGAAGLWASRAAEIQPVLLIGDPLDGKTVAGIQFQADGIEGTTVAFAASFTDGSSGVYTTTLVDAGAPGALEVAQTSAAR